MKFTVAAVLMALLISNVQAKEEQSINKEIQALKSEVISLHRDLFILEQDLLFPINTQVAVYVSMDVGKYFELDAITLNIDGDNVTHYLYTEKQIASLQKGGIQRLYLGNVNPSDHEIIATLEGTGPNNRQYKIATTETFNKDKKALSIELKISDSLSKEHPVLKLVKR